MLHGKKERLVALGDVVDGRNVRSRYNKKMLSRARVLGLEGNDLRDSTAWLQFASQTARQGIMMSIISISGYGVIYVSVISVCS